MAKTQAKTQSVVNGVLQKFLLELSVDNMLRRRFSEASKEQKRQLLATTFKIGDKTIDALLSGVAGRVKARLRFSDQQGTPTRKPGGTTRKAGSRTTKKR